jgi:hypothetical protein
MIVHHVSKYLLYGLVYRLKLQSSKAFLNLGPRDWEKFAYRAQLGRFYHFFSLKMETDRNATFLSFFIIFNEALNKIHEVNYFKSTFFFRGTSDIV